MAMADFPKYGYHRLRLGWGSLPGQMYLLTTVTAQRKAYFLDKELALTAATMLSRAETWLPNRCLSWVLMPDHCHALVELGEGSDLSRVMQKVKGNIAHRARTDRLINDTLWAKGFHDHALRRDESVLEVVRYIVANPVRAGLARDVGDYPYWGVNFDGRLEGFNTRIPQTSMTDPARCGSGFGGSGFSRDRPGAIRKKHRD